MKLTQFNSVQLINMVNEADRYKDIIIRGIKEINVSLDFFDFEKHNYFRGNKNAYQWAIGTLNFCKENNIKVNIVFIGTNDTLQKSNLDGLFKIVKKYNCVLKMNIFRPTFGINDKVKSFIPEYDKICKAIEYINQKYSCFYNR